MANSVQPVAVFNTHSYKPKLHLPPPGYSHSKLLFLPNYSTPSRAPSLSTCIDSGSDSKIAAPTQDVRDTKLHSEGSEGEMDTESPVITEELDGHTGDLIYPEAQLSREMSKALILSYASRHKLSYAALGDLLHLLSLHFPKSTTLPTGYR